MCEMPPFAEDETLTDNLMDDIALRLLRLGERVWLRCHNCGSNLIEVIRLVNELGGADSEAMRVEITGKISVLSGISFCNSDLDLEDQIENITQLLEENYATKK